MEQTQIIRPNDIASKRVATSAFTIDVRTASMLLRDFFSNMMETRRLPNLLNDAPLVQVQMSVGPKSGQLMLAIIPSTLSHAVSHYAISSISYNLTLIVSKTGADFKYSAHKIEDKSPGIFACANRSKILCAIEDSLVARPKGFGISTYSISSFEVFDPFAERMALVYDAIPYLDVVVH